MAADANRVIIVGAGPVGLLCALSLASRDVAVLVLEANDDLFMDLREGSAERFARALSARLLSS